MTPYYDQDGITIYHGRCEDVLPALPEEGFRLVLTDPPYSEVTHAGAVSRNSAATIATGRLVTGSTLTFDRIDADDLLAVFAQVARVASGWVVSFMDWRHIYRIEREPPPGLRFVRFGIWDKTNGAPQFTGDRPAAGWEGVAILHKLGGRMTWNGGGHRAVWSGPKDNGAHETQKPLWLTGKLVSLFSNKGDAVLDPFMGSGRVLQAAKLNGCRAVGIEREEKWCELAASRMEQGVLNFAE